MKIFIYSVLAAMLCAAPALAQPEKIPRETEMVAHSADVAGQIKRELDPFVLKFNQLSLVSDENLFSLFFDAHEGYFGAREWLRDIQEPFAAIKLVLLDVDEIKQDGDTVHAVVSYKFNFLFGVERTVADATVREEWKRERREEVIFKKTSGVRGDDAMWKIIPPAIFPGDLTNDINVPQDAKFWAIVAYHLAQKQPYKRIISPAEISLSNLSKLGQGALDFMSENNGRYAFAPRFVTTALGVSLDAFFVPDTNETYVFNANVSDKKLFQSEEMVERARKIVMFYEGQNEKPIFRYDGKAAICFADGHVALVTPDEAKSLIWKP